MITICRRDVYRMKLTPNEGVKPKEKEDEGRNKFFVVLGEDIDGNIIGFVLINSHINPYLTDEVKDLHYPISKNEYPFLDGVNRFVDCNKIKRITRKRFDELFKRDSKKGEINEYDFNLIVETLKSSPSVTPKELKRLGL